MKKEVGFDIESVAHALPMPLEGPVLNIYQIAREAQFDSNQINTRFRNISEEELPNADFLFTTKDRKMTTEFLPIEYGTIANDEIRRERYRTTIIRDSDHSS